MASAAFTINGVAVPRSDGVAVSLVSGENICSLVDVSGAAAISWDIVGLSDSDVVAPSLTIGGTPFGRTATFTRPDVSSLNAGRGVGYGIRCKVTDANGTEYTAFGVCGVTNSNGVVPGVAGEEEGWRHATLGWTPNYNAATLINPRATARTQTTNAVTATACAISFESSTVNYVYFSSSCATDTWSKYAVKNGCAVFRCDSAGVVTQLGSTVGSALDITNDAAITFTLDISSDTVRFRTTGLAATTINWETIVWAQTLRI